jgi:outer membrane protein OmpU
MTSKKLLLGTTALLGAGMLATTSATAAQVTPRGALDIEVGGFFSFLTGIGDLREKRGDNSGSYDFRNDTEVFFTVRGTDEATGIEYGVVIELEADTDSSLNSDETYMFIRGGFGEFRLGDEDGPEDNMRLGAPTIAAGTGGIDGIILDTPRLYAGVDTADATKVIYYTPRIAGFQVGLGYTPSVGSNGQNIRQTNNGALDDVFEGGVNWRGAFGGVDLNLSATGWIGEFNQGPGDRDANRWNVGGVFGLFGFQLAASYHATELGGDEIETYTVGAAATLGPAKVSVSWGDTLDADDNVEPSSLVVGAAVGLFPGVDLSAEVSWFDEDRGGDDDGVLGVARIRAQF